MKIIQEKSNVRICDAESFDLAQTLDCGQSFRFKECDDGSWQGIALGRNIQLSADENDIIIHDMDLDEFNEKFFDYFTLGIDYASIKKEFCGDNYLKKAIEYASGIRLLKQDKWECVCSFIISQNNNIPRIKGIIERLCESFGQKCDGGYTFPNADVIANLSLEELAPLRAGFRAKYILDASQKFAKGEIDLEKLETAPLDEARDELMKIKGVGPKVADCVLLFSCGRLDAFPQDVWIKRAVAQLYPSGLPECFGKYAGIAQQYLFHYVRTTDIVK